MDEKIYLSVILSTYNEEKYILESVNSILNQTYPYFELIIVNDGSTDSTSEILKSITDSRVTVINKGNSGLADSLNVGIKVSKYDWIARMDGDDVAELDRFERQVSYLNDSVDIVGGQYRVIDSEGKLKSSSVSHKPLTTLKCKRDILFGMSPLVHPTVIIRKSLLDKYGGYDANFFAAQDFELWARLSPNATMINIPDAILKYRKHSNTITHNRYELQMKLTFLGYLKYVLKIRKPLTREEFKIIENYFSNNGLIITNKKLFDASHRGEGMLRTIKIVLYYLWRIFVFIKYRLLGASIRNTISI